MKKFAISPALRPATPKDPCNSSDVTAGRPAKAPLKMDEVKTITEKTVANLRGRWPGVDTHVAREVDRVLVPQD